MNGSPLHRVFRCIMEVQGVARADVTDWQRRARGFWTREIAPVFEAECDAICPPGVALRLDRLELELRVNPRQPEAGLGPAFRQALRERLEPHRSRLRQLPLPAPATGPVEPDARRDRLEQWLVTGLMPWWAGRPELGEIAAELLDRLRAPTGPPWLRRILTTHPAAGQRLALQFDGAWQRSALRAVWPSHWPAAESSHEPLAGRAGGPSPAAPGAPGTARPAGEGKSTVARDESQARGTFLDALTAAVGTPSVAGEPLARAGVWATTWALWARASALSSELVQAASEAATATDLAAVGHFQALLAREAGLPVPPPPASEAAGMPTAGKALPTSGAPMREAIHTRDLESFHRLREALFSEAAAPAGLEPRSRSADGHVRGPINRAADPSATEGPLPQKPVAPSAEPPAFEPPRLEPNPVRPRHEESATEPLTFLQLREECGRLWAGVTEPSPELETLALQAAGSNNVALLERFRAALLSATLEVAPPTGLRPATPVRRGRSAPPVGLRAPHVQVEASVPEDRSSSPARLEVEAALTPGLPVANAGLVLTAPFLPSFFAALGIRLVPDPVERSGAGLAPLVLHLIATGADQAAEHQLALPKLLCGIPFEEPVICDHAFPEATLVEVDRLLTSVIEHWAALKETSSQSLRSAFLERRGLLRDTGPQWQLRVEHRAWDVLLDRVPWTFRTLRLPWMPRPLMVEWDAYA